MNMEDIKGRIAEGNFDAVEDAWMAAIEADAPLSQMRETLDALVSAEHIDAAETLVWMLLSDAVERRSTEEALDVGRAVLPALHGNRELRATVADLYEQLHGQTKHFDEILDASGLKAHQSLRRAMSTLDTCLALQPGTYVANRFDHQVLRVDGFEPVMGQFELTAAGGRKTQIEPKLLADEFEVVNENDFRVLCRFRTDELGEVVQSDPATVLMGICMSHGGRIDATALKDLLVPRYMDKDKWSGWWNRARTAVKRSRKLSLEGRNPTVVCYHPHGRSLEEELADALDKVRVPLDYLAVLRAYAQGVRQRRQEIDAQFVGPILQTLAEQAESFKARRPADALAAALVIEAAAELSLPPPALVCPTPAEVLAGADRPVEAVTQLSDTSLWPAAMDALARRDDAPRQFAALLSAAPPGQLDAIAAHLRAMGHADAVGRVVDEALADPAANLDVCLWLWRGPAEPVEGLGSRLDLLSRVLSLTEEIGRDWDMKRETRRDAYQQIRSALVADDCKAFRAAIAEMDDAVAETIKRRIERSGGLSPTSRDALLGILREEFHGLFLKGKTEPWLDEGVLWTIAESLQRQEAELKELREVTIPANSRAIGAAAELGDLSENSEWQYAIEERRRLQAKVSQMQNDLMIARVLHPKDPPADSVGVGSRVTLRGADDGHEVVVTFLGPWESDPARHIYSYKTPLAQSLMGQPLGASVPVKIDGVEGQYTIERLASGVPEKGPPMQQAQT